MTTQVWTQSDITVAPPPAKPPRTGKVGRPFTGVTRVHVLVDVLFRNQVDEIVDMTNFATASEAISQSVGYHHDIVSHMTLGGTCTFVCPSGQRIPLPLSRTGAGLGVEHSMHITMNPLTLHRTTEVAAMTNSETMPTGVRMMSCVNDFWHFLHKIKEGAHLVLESPNGRPVIYMPWRT